MFDFFKKKSVSDADRQRLVREEQSSHVAPGTQIHFVPELIKDLKGDHKELLDLYGQIKKAFDARKYSQVTEKLKAFKMILTDHLLIENIRLYIYLGHSFANDEMNASLVKEFRSEMNQISKVVMNFLTRYEAIGVDKELAATFGKDLEEIGQALVERISREERTLYPLYLPSY